MTAGTPALNKPLPDKTEAEARIQAALKVARHGLMSVRGRHGSGSYIEASVFGREAIEQIITILEDR